MTGTSVRMRPREECQGRSSAKAFQKKMQALVLVSLHIAMLKAFATRVLTDHQHIAWRVVGKKAGNAAHHCFSDSRAAVLSHHDQVGIQRVNRVW